VINDVALIVTALGVLSVMFGLRQSRRERLRKFEAMYIERYWNILDGLSLEALRGSESARVSSGDEEAIRRYIVLCEDELEMRQDGYISDDTYKVWAHGMIDQLLCQPMFRKVWRLVKEEATFPYVHLSRLLELRDPNAGDPLSMSALGRRVRGLRGTRGALHHAVALLAEARASRREVEPRRHAVPSATSLTRWPESPSSV
jgi:hypothetical protein